MRSLAFTLFTCLSMGLVAQVDIIGIWTYVEPVEKESMDAEGLEMMGKIFGSMSFQFDENGAYRVGIMGRPEDGTWRLLEDDRIELTALKGRVEYIGVHPHSEGYMVFDMQGKTFVMRWNEAVETLSPPVEPEAELANVLAESLHGKWTITMKVKGSEIGQDIPEKRVEMRKSLLEGGYMEFMPEGNYEVSILGLSEQGTWTLNESGSLISTMADGMSKEWYILEMDEKLMKLQQGVAGDIYTFSKTSR